MTTGCPFADDLVLDPESIDGDFFREAADPVATDLSNACPGADSAAAIRGVLLARNAPATPAEPRNNALRRSRADVAEIRLLCFLELVGIDTSRLRREDYQIKCPSGSTGDCSRPLSASALGCSITLAKQGEESL